MPCDIPVLTQNISTTELRTSVEWMCPVLGNTKYWPLLLKSLLSTIQSMDQPMAVFWGPELLYFPNKAIKHLPDSAQYAAQIGTAFTGVDGGFAPFIYASLKAIWLADAVPTSDSPRAQSHEVKAACGQIWGCNINPIFEFDNPKQVAGVIASWTQIADETSVHDELAEIKEKLSAERRYRHEVEACQSFKMDFADALRRASGANERACIALQMTSLFVGSDHGYYIKIVDSNCNDPAAKCQILNEWHRDKHFPNTLARDVVVDFGSVVFDQLSENKNVVINDVLNDQRFGHLAADGISGMGRSFLLSPIFRADALTAFFALTYDSPHEWDTALFEIVAEVAERTFNAVEYALEYGKRLEAELVLKRQTANEHARLQSMFQHAPGFMCLLRGPDHVFELINDSYLKMIGSRALIGMKARDALAGLPIEQLHSLLDKAYASGLPFTAVDMAITLPRGATNDRAITYVDFVVQPIVDTSGLTTGIFVEGFDVTERTLSKKALETSEQRLKAGMAAAKMVIWDWNLLTDQVIFHGSERYFFDQDICAIRAIWDQVDPDDIERLHLAHATALNGADSYCEIVRLVAEPDKNSVWVQIQGQVDRNNEGRPYQIRGLCIDVTALKEAELKVLDASKRKDQFLAMLAHELRNPLAPIVASAEIMSRANFTDITLHRASLILKRQASHMTALVSDMLDVSRVTTGNVVLSKQAVSLYDVLLDSVEQVRPLIDAKYLTCKFDSTASPAVVIGDQKRLVQIFTNLLQNSAKFTPAGGKIYLSIQNVGTCIEVIVRDDGIGIDPKLISHIFELFVQGENVNDRSQGGLGLGLSLVKTLIELHDGSITAFSRGLNQGAEFKAKFPRSSETPISRPRTRIMEAPVRSKNTHIFLVDDNDDAAQMLAFLLKKEGYRVTTADHPVQALELTAEELPDVFILDIGLPGMDGNELVKRLKLMPSCAKIPMIALTGYGSIDDMNTARKSGFDRFFVKPVEIEKLLIEISKIQLD